MLLTRILSATSTDVFLIYRRFRMMRRTTELSVTQIFFRIKRLVARFPLITRTRSEKRVSIRLVLSTIIESEAMLRLLKRKFRAWRRKTSPPPPISDQSTLDDIARQQPHLFEFLSERYRLAVTESDRKLPLAAFVAKYGLPPSQILYMQVQLHNRVLPVKSIRPEEALLLLDEKKTRLLDVREDWEVALCRIERSERLDSRLLEEILEGWDKDTPIVLYCHFGVRSLDAASFLAERGFRNVHTVKGGIDAWAVDVDPKIGRYEGSWC